jgi:hypothetical protein
VRFAHWVRAHLLQVQGSLTGLWLVAIVPSLIWWSHSIAWVVFMSVWANVAGHGAGWVAALAERDQRDA